MRVSKPRKTLGVLESTALFFISARASGNLECSAMDLLAEFSRYETRDVSPSGCYLLLESLERKGLIASAARVSEDAVGRLRPIRFYEVTDLGMQLAAAEYQAQASIIQEVRIAFAPHSGTQVRKY